MRNAGRAGTNDAGVCRRPSLCFLTGWLDKCRKCAQNGCTHARSVTRHFRFSWTVVFPVSRPGRDVMWSSGLLRAKSRRLSKFVFFLLFCSHCSSSSPISKKLTFPPPSFYKLIHSLLGAYALSSAVRGMGMNQFVNKEFPTAFTREDRFYRCVKGKG